MAQCNLQLLTAVAVWFAVFAAALAQKARLQEPVLANRRCEIGGTLPCGGPGISRVACETMNCCFDGRRCYYGNPVTVQCTEKGEFVVVVAKVSAAPHMVLPVASRLGVGDPSCGPVAASDDFDVYHFPVTACGTMLKVEGNYMVFENRLSLVYESGAGLLHLPKNTSCQELMVKCRYLPIGSIPLASDQPVIQPLMVSSPGPLRVELRLAKGLCSTQGCHEGADAYASYYDARDAPVAKVLQQPVYVEVHIVGRTDPNLVLLLEQCWATSSPNPLSLPQWSLLVNGCPYQGDKYQTTLVPVDAASGLPFPNHYKRFIVKMFTFVNPVSQPVREKVFIHCSTAVCHLSATDNCVQRCFRKGRDLSSVQKNLWPEAIVSSQEVLLLAPGTDYENVVLGL